MFGFGKDINGPWIITGVQEDPTRSEENCDCNQHCRDQVGACLPKARKVEFNKRTGSDNLKYKRV